MGKKRSRKAIPLVAAATGAASTASQPMKSRKRARQVTTLFHKLTRERDMAQEQGDEQKVQECESQLEQMGGRPEYQRASQLSTSFHSTSKKWVLGYLASNGWIYGIKEGNSSNLDDDMTSKSAETAKEQRKVPRRTTRILEVGAINTDLLDAAESASKSNMISTQSNERRKRNNIHVRSIDLHAMDPRIEEHDFLQLCYISDDVYQRYDVVVCSMVLNCVTTPNDRGTMLFGLFHHLRPGGLCFLTIPKFCVTKSAFLNPSLFQKMLGETGVGFEVVSVKESPRIAFFVLQRPISIERKKAVDKIWSKQVVRNKGKKFPNQFSVVLNKDHVHESTLHDDQSSQDHEFDDGSSSDIK
jgi:25S rRNA (adenine2142-N1)-methyltransferase